MFWSLVQFHDWAGSRTNLFTILQEDKSFVLGRGLVRIVDHASGKEDLRLGAGEHGEVDADDP